MCTWRKWWSDRICKRMTAHEPTINQDDNNNDNHHWSAVWKPQCEQKTESQTLENPPKTDWELPLWHQKLHRHVPRCATVRWSCQRLVAKCTKDIWWCLKTGTPENHYLKWFWYGCGYHVELLFFPIFRDCILMFHPSFVHFNAREGVHRLNRDWRCSDTYSPARSQQIGRYLQSILNQSKYEFGQVRGSSLYQYSMTGFIKETCHKPGCRCIMMD